MKCDALLVVGSKTSHIAAAEHMHTCMDKTRSSILKARNYEWRTTLLAYHQGNPNPVISFGERESAVYYDCPPAAHPTASAQFLNVPKKDPSTS